MSDLKYEVQCSFDEPDSTSTVRFISRKGVDFMFLKQTPINLVQALTKRTTSSQDIKTLSLPIQNICEHIKGLGLTTKLRMGAMAGAAVAEVPSMIDASVQIHISKDAYSVIGTQIRSMRTALGGVGSL